MIPCVQLGSPLGFISIKVTIRTITSLAFETLNNTPPLPRSHRRRGPSPVGVSGPVCCVKRQCGVYPTQKPEKPGPPVCCVYDPLQSDASAHRVHGHGRETDRDDG